MATLSAEFGSDQRQRRTLYPCRVFGHRLNVVMLFGLCPGARILGEVPSFYGCRPRSIRSLTIGHILTGLSVAEMGGPVPGVCRANGADWILVIGRKSGTTAIRLLFMFNGVEHVKRVGEGCSLWSS